MSAIARLRSPSTWFGMGCLLALCAISIENLHFTDSLLGTAYHRSQAIWMVLGLMVAGLIASLDTQLIRKAAMTAYVMLVLLLGLVLVVGREINYSRRWIELGPVNIQPSEFMKLAVVLVLADWFDKKRSPEPWQLRQLLVPVLYMLVPVALINREPDLGTSLCVGFIAAGVILYEGVRRKTLMIALFVSLLGLGVAWQSGVIRDYQKGRVEAWYLSMDDDTLGRQKPSSERSQAELALWAIGSGRLAGRSDDEARSSVLRHLPFVHTDFALAPFAERFGLLGCLALFSLYFGLVGWALYLADKAQDRFDTLVAVGVAGLVFWQFFINAGMVIGLLPVVGITLPIFSYGGSSALTVLLGAGFLLNVATRRKAR
jgi:rod shape determining protein RodA